MNFVLSNFNDVYMYILLYITRVWLISIRMVNEIDLKKK